MTSELESEQSSLRSYQFVAESFAKLNEDNSMKLEDLTEKTDYEVLTIL